MFTPTTQTSNMLLVIARLQKLISSHLREISCCCRELRLCTKDPFFNAHEWEALEIQISSLNAEVAQWREEIRHYREQYARLLGLKSDFTPLDDDKDAA